MNVVRTLLVIFCLGTAAVTGAAEFRSVGDQPAIMYDAPSAKATRLFVASRMYPVEIIVPLDAWVKVRDQTGDLAWIEKKSLTDKRTVVVTAAVADVRTAAEEKSTSVYQAQKGVALEVIEIGSNGWIKVRHRDGQAGFVRINQVWGI